jgi:serine/threonine protein phosphatase PrpC
MPNMTDTAPTIQRQLADWLMRLSPAIGVRRVLPLAAALATDIGLVRGENQDRAAVARGRTRAGRTFAIAAIADGIGGMKEGGWWASNALAELFSSALRYVQDGERPEVCLEQAVRDANTLVHARSNLSGGTTLVALLLVEGQPPCWASVGDSRLYQASDSSLTQLSRDDTIAGQLGKHTDIALEQSKLLQFVGIGDPLEILVEQADAGPEDVALLTTDGVHFLERTGGVFALVVRNSNDAGTCVRRVTELARWAGGPDNASALAIPFFPELNNHPLSPQCIEVWDSFGEIRIVASELGSVAEQSQGRGFSPDSHAHANIVSSDEGVAPNRTELAKSALAQEIEPKKRKRKSRKKADSPVGKAPQVQLQFSGKDD